MNETWPEKTERYLSGGMGAKEKSLFESEMRRDSELSSYVDLYKQIEADMRTKEKYNDAEEALKRSLARLNSIYFSEDRKDDLNTAPATKETPARSKRETPLLRLNKEQRTINWKIVAVAAIILGIVAAGTLWYFKGEKQNGQVATSVKQADTGVAAVRPDTAVRQKITTTNIALQNKRDTSTAKKSIKKNPQELFAENFKPDAVPDDTEGPLDDAFTYYQQRRYADAAAEFTTANINTQTRGNEADPERTVFYVKYYAGLSYLAGNHALAAITELKKAEEESPDDLYQVKTQWYLALAYLKAGDIKNAKEMLSNVSTGQKNAEYQLKAEKLLDALMQTH
jgi:tetratricopeptide (TPR) repeat protein